MNIRRAVEVSYPGRDIDNKTENYYISFKSIFPEKFASGFIPFPTVKDALTTLDDRGLKLGVYTGLNRMEAEYILRKTGLIDFFRVIVTVDDVEDPRPNPQGLFLTMKKLGLDEDEVNKCIYVGDAVLDIMMAKNAKIRIACVKTGVQDNKLLENEHPDYFVDDFSKMMEQLSDELPDYSQP